MSESHFFEDLTIVVTLVDDWKYRGNRFYFIIMTLASSRLVQWQKFENLEILGRFSAFSKCSKTHRLWAQSNRSECYFSNFRWERSQMHTARYRKFSKPTSNGQSVSIFFWTRLMCRIHVICEIFILIFASSSPSLNVYNFIVSSNQRMLCFFSYALHYSSNNNICAHCARTLVGVCVKKKYHKI